MSWEFEWLYVLQHIHTPMLDAIMVFLSHLGDMGLFWIALGIVFCFPKSMRKCGIQMLLSIVVTFVIGNLIIKNLVGRSRPCWIDPNVVLLLPNPADFSFPSGHTMNGFTAAVSIFCNNKRIGMPALVLASLIAFSRLYNFVHFPTDILGGAVIGTIVAIIVHRFSDGRLNSRLKQSGEKEH